jgi:hypothetical protein
VYFNGTERISNNDLLMNFPTETNVKGEMSVADKDSKDVWSCYIDNNVKCRTITFAVVF